jgi:hypothetical protein
MLKSAIAGAVAEARQQMQDAVAAALDGVQEPFKAAVDAATAQLASTLAKAMAGQIEALKRSLRAIKIGNGAAGAPRPALTPVQIGAGGRPPPSARPAAAAPVGADGLPGPQRQLLGALAWWAANGHDMPTRGQVGGFLGWKVDGHLKNVAGAAKTAGLIDYPAPGLLGLTRDGVALAPEPDHAIPLLARARGHLTGPQQQVFDQLAEHGAMTREALGSILNWDVNGHLKNIVGSMRTLEIVDYPTRGEVALQAWIK